MMPPSCVVSHVRNSQTALLRQNQKASFKNSLLPRFIFLSLSLLLNCTNIIAGELTLDEIFTDHLVVQRNQLWTVSGWAAPHATVSVTFAGQNKSGKSDDKGCWLVTLDALSASSQPQKLTVAAGTETMTLQDILIGDVWLCSGQLNMDRPLKNFSQLNTNLGSVNLPMVRLFAVNRSLYAMAGPISLSVISLIAKGCQLRHSVRTPFRSL